MNKKLKDFTNSRVFIVILVLVLICTVFLVGTYAWFTWSSPNNTKFVMTIGNDIADVTFESGNEISTGLLPVYNYSEGVSTTFSINNRGTTDTGIIIYRVKFNITLIDDKLINNGVKYALVKDGTLVAQGDLSNAYNGASLTLNEDYLGFGVSSFALYFYIDASVENDLSMVGKSISGNIMVEADNSDLTVTPLSDFTYYLGSEYSTVEEITSYDYSEEIKVSPISLEENEVLLVRYNGDSADVVVSNTYIVDGVAYNVIILSFAQYAHREGDDNDIIFSEGGSAGTFCHNDSIESVFFVGDIEFIYSLYSRDIYYGSSSYDDLESRIFENSATLLFSGCSNLLSVPEIPDSVTTMDRTFLGCTSLVNAPVIPNSVTNMSYTFSGCTSLVNSPVIPDSVTSLYATFLRCTSLVNAPAIPNSVTSLYQTFSGCTKLVNAPVIPDSVTDMEFTFEYCTNLTGTVRINSSNVTDAERIFNGTSKAIIVEVPTGSTTYTKISALTTSNGMPSNVTLSTFDAS